TGLPPTPSYDPSGGSSLSGGLKLDRFGRVATPGKDNDLMRQPLYPGASVEIMGHPLAPDRSSDQYGRQHQPGSPVGQPVLPRCQQERADDREEEERREGVRGIPPLPYHATTHWYSGGSPPRITSKATSWEGKSSRSAVPARGTWSWLGKGTLAGLAGVLAALFSALFGKKKDQGR